MPKSKKIKESKSEEQKELTLGSDGQYTLLPDIPDYIRKAHGPVMDSVLSQDLLDKTTTLLIDDTSEASDKPIPIQTRVMLSYEGIDFNIKGKVRLNAFDREVIDAVASLAQHNEVITAAMIYRVMMGKRDYQYVTPQQQKRVLDSMMKCGYSKLQLDLTDMFEKDSPIGKQLKDEGLSASYSGNLISFEVLSIRSGKKFVDCFRILAEPAIIRYATSLGKVSEFPIDLLDTSINKTERNIILQSYLLRCIDEMYRGESPCLIDFEKLYAAIDGAEETNQHKARFRATAMTILDDWVKKGFIKSYRVHSAGRKVKNLQIELLSRDSEKEG